MLLTYCIFVWPRAEKGVHTIITLLCRWRNAGTEMLSILPKVTQLGSGGSCLFPGHSNSDPEILEFHGSRMSKGEGNGTPLQYSCLGNPMDGGAWWATVHGVEKSQTQLSDFTFTFHFHALEKEMATHSGVLPWRVPGMGAWWAAVYGVTQSWTRLTWLRSSRMSKNLQLLRSW